MYIHCQGDLKKCLIPSQTILEKKTNLLDQAIVQKLINLLALMKNAICLNGLHISMCIRELHDPLQGR